MLQTQKFQISGSTQFGESLLLTNNTLFIAEGGWSSTKNVHAYSRSNGLWSKTSLLNPEGNYPLLAATDDMIVSSSSSNTYIFTNSGSAWSTTAMLSGGSSAAAISESTLLTSVANMPGYGLVFQKISSAWTQIASLVPSVSMSAADKCQIGLSEDSKVAGLCGNNMAFIFEDVGTDTWTQTAQLTPSVAGGGYFGMHVSVTSTTALASHPVYPNSYGAGALVSFSKIGGQWSQQQFLIGHDASFNQYFTGGTNYYRYASLGWYGFSYNANTVVSNLINYDTAYVFSRASEGSRWTETQKLQPSDAIIPYSPENLEFRFGHMEFNGGCAMACYGEDVVIGARLHDGVSPYPGAAYAYNSDPTRSPTTIPTLTPTFAPSSAPSLAPTFKPSSNPTLVPTFKPSSNPSLTPTFPPSVTPTFKPSSNPTLAPTSLPSVTPTLRPSMSPTISFAPTTTPRTRGSGGSNSSAKNNLIIGLVVGLVGGTAVIAAVLFFIFKGTATAGASAGGTDYHTPNKAVELSS